MKEKIKTILLIIVTASIVIFCLAYTLRFLIDYGCSSPSLYNSSGDTAKEFFGSWNFLSIKCAYWHKALQFQVNW